jgi:hypothetical protein
MGANVTLGAFPCGGASVGTANKMGPDNGSFMLKTSDIIVGAPQAGGSCITICLKRAVTGTVDPALDVGDSHFDITRSDYVSVNVMP